MELGSRNYCLEAGSTPAVSDHEDLTVHEPVSKAKQLSITVFEGSDTEIIEF